MFDEYNKIHESPLFPFPPFYSSDFKSIHSNNHLITFDEYNKIHESHKEFLKNELERAKVDSKKVLVLSHHKPTLQRGEIPKNASHMFQSGEEVSSVFESDCDFLFELPLVCWIYGHTHVTEKHGSLKVNNIPIFSNQVGYFVRGVPNWMEQNSFFDATWFWKYPN